ncbi:MAG: U-box domain-containing protein [Coxiellaceae bacterium]|nr:MAG: U-box domain-containing protein [Coxiellaceae bacterium]
MFTLNNNDNTKDLLENDLECPISRDIMKDPVTTCDGYTYDNSDITQWLKSNNRSPQTNLPLANKGLVPNLLLKKRFSNIAIMGMHMYLLWQKIIDVLLPNK